ncbi:MAG: hypothetical protein NVSMB38_11000 [Ktedonobacteraceae bacterium]
MPIATDPLSLVFIACFLFGLLFMLAATLIGSLGHGSHSVHGVHSGTHVGHIDAGSTLHTGHNTHFVHTPHHVVKGPLVKTNSAGYSRFSMFAYANPTTIALFLLGFGFFGYIFHDTAGFVLPLTIILAAVGGLIIAALLLALLGRVFGDSEGETIQDVSDRTGLLGKVSITIQENNLGEVLYVSPGGMRKSVPARSVDGRRLERDQEVVVVNYQHGVADVDTWDHFVNRDDISSDAVPDEDEMAALRVLLEEPEKKDTQFVMRKDTQKE